MCYSILFYSTLSENLNPLYYTYHLPTFLIPHSSLHPPEKPKLFSLSLSKPVSFFSLLSPPAGLSRGEEEN